MPNVFKMSSNIENTTKKIWEQRTKGKEKNLVLKTYQPLSPKMI
jgi:hypothetical protein